MIVVGIDLSGPGNAADTAVAVFEGNGGGLRLRQRIAGASDADILSLISHLPLDAEVVVALDAPLSYQPGGGDRPSDRALRQLLMARGLRPGTVMPPTLTRMVYLTLRGLTVARQLESLRHPSLHLVEVHPGGAMALRGAPVADVTRFKTDPGARSRLLAWLARQKLAGVPSSADLTDHEVAACACVLGGWYWRLGTPVWLAAAAPPAHPYDFAC